MQTAHNGGGTSLRIGQSILPIALVATYQRQSHLSNLILGTNCGSTSITLSTSLVSINTHTTYPQPWSLARDVDDVRSFGTLINWSSNKPLLKTDVHSYKARYFEDLLLSRVGVAE